MSDRESWRRLLERPVAWQTALIWVVAFSLVVVAVPHGDYLAAFLVIVAAVALDYGGRFVNSRRPGRPARLQESALLPYSPETVWSLILPPEKAPLLDSNIRRGYREPGLPDGVGARHVFEGLDGRTVTVEVIEFEPNRRAVVRVLPPAPNHGVRVSATLQPMEEGCLYSVGVEIDRHRTQHILQRFKDTWHSEVRANIERLRQVLADAERDRAAIVVSETPVVANVDSPPPEAAPPGK